MLGIQGLADASFKGDPRWKRASKWTGYGPWIVLTLAVLSMIEIALGAVWISSMKTELNFAQVIQPLIVPGLCFFNTIPSLHLHVLARVNPPRLALWFSATLSALLFVSALVFIGSCAGRSGNNNKGSLQRDECPAGTGGKAGIWDAMVALQLVSAVMYAAMAVMAWKVKSVLEARDQRIAAGVELVSQEEKERRESEARERWRYLSAG
ncbi:hypothetical protein HRR83_000948 [Exophiala dermatitidis]|uniref:MARVEL domain-containing protein n=2 Tax=Exophiala dermatitidis TaxID=5970 RepID=H6CBP1_EXODN|nr:uncharacterized protein HMPREF1120_09125 [Exophiala dermatitidis NIH/UT8656]KAJ4525270.1 hypothetical protein HRR75_000861 [Exophiala dermatitidis]EHY61189.1 hypothetical protein HMPREF1120_09125 [Exophiala dermatitidis NIH/UT8656]KAJ4528197.1 hypothetical protein HRR74_000952 [Exophiala dermatitidis]KAJ4528830.1 hypothetical protein HRR73_001453 [Exophiala dermatitidis]KAJ4530219.1 hypothetical protein HRR76_009449 [Exophiala dermatitidis]